MTSNRPYLIRAIHEWLLDNQCTPHLLVNAQADGADVPRQYIQDGRIVLNVGPQAVEDFNVTNETVSFHARFNGVSQLVSFPVMAVLAIYAKENSGGMVFQEDEPDPDDSGPGPASRPSLKVVK